MDEKILREEVEYVKAVLREMHADAEERSFNPDDQAAWDAGVEFVRTSEAALVALEERKARIAEFAPVAEETGDGAVAPINVNTHTARDAFDHSTLTIDGGSELRGRALDVIEKHLPSYVDDSARENATRLLERRSSDADIVARHIVRTSSPEYLRAFEEYVENPQAGMPRILTKAEARTAMSLTAANGGVLVPQFLDPTIILTNTGSSNQVRQIASQASITVDQWDGVTSAGVTAEWLAEGTEAADATPTFVGPTITVHKAAAWLFGSYEVIADSGFAQVGELIADARDRLEEAAHVNGTGSGQPYGLITRLSGTGPVVAGTSGAAGAADLVAADAYALDNALGARFRSNASFLAARATYNKFRQATDANANFWAAFGGGQPAQMIGYPTYQNESMDTTIVSGSNDFVLILGDFSNYKIIDRIGVEIMYEPMVKGSNQRPTGQAGWFAFWRTGADVLTSNAFKVLKV
jgi:HK97 family phage major capsid protein